APPVCQRAEAEHPAGSVRPGRRAGRPFRLLPAVVRAAALAGTPPAGAVGCLSSGSFGSPAHRQSLAGLLACMQRNDFVESMNAFQRRPALELRHPELMAAVAEEGSLAAATRRLHLTASALSHQLRDAEQRLGVALFLRRHRRLVLTGAGERLLQASRQLLAEARRAEASISGPSQEVIRVSNGCHT